ncbi:hypothetical protein [Rufibacter sp. XAAS-G3-1]|uniref:hypothetical protein n=1 Tax=Rufibacter sp. XAAS-G3-1 TaxID=2729134 RepID=UPI0015E6A871|nr:hypothetical protein [Rufibacter sp. XAAS-G3-1]
MADFSKNAKDRRRKKKHHQPGERANKRTPVKSLEHGFLASVTGKLLLYEGVSSPLEYQNH